MTQWGKMGFTRGNVLDPAAGIGNFMAVCRRKCREAGCTGRSLTGLPGVSQNSSIPMWIKKSQALRIPVHPNDFFDVAVGNVPFGQYKVSDRQYDRHNFLIHDYFFAKTLDKVRPGGIVAFVTSKGQWIRKPGSAEIPCTAGGAFGAVRLPNTAFKENAGTEVTSDILFLKKRDRVLDIEPDWVHLTEKDGIVMNQYFADHPERMVLGKNGDGFWGAWHGKAPACGHFPSLVGTAKMPFPMWRAASNRRI